MGKAAENSLIKIATTGPESTGKTTLTKKLSEYYDVPCVSEYAREYVQQLNRPYTYDDIIHIAKKQIEIEKEYSNKYSYVLFFDTYLIITKVWLEVVFNKCPQWINDQLKQRTIDLYLLCVPDIPWVCDPVRENGGEMRQKLFNKYKQELEMFNLNYKVISGEKRFELALQYTNEFINVSRNPKI